MLGCRHRYLHPLVQTSPLRLWIQYCYYKKVVISSSYESAAVADSGQWVGCVSSHVYTNRLFMWDCMTMDEATRDEETSSKDNCYNVMDN